MILDKATSRRNVREIKLSPGQRRKPFTLKVGSRTRTVFPGRSGILGQSFVPFYANDTTAYRPEMWAAEAVNVLNEEMVYGGIVHRDFNKEIAAFGETVHTRKPAAFEAKRKQNDLDDLVDQDATAAGIDVVLNQRAYVSFLLGDADRSLSFQELVNIYLREAVIAEARLLDQVIGAQVYQFLGNSAGGLGLLTSSNSHDYLLDIREIFNTNKTPLNNRWLGLASKSETTLQKTTLFKSAEQIGDAGQALRNAILGRVAGWNTFMELNTPSVRLATQTSATGLIDVAYPAGTTVVVMETGDVASAGIVKGCYITIAGDMTPLRVLSISTETLTLNRPLKNAVANAAVVTVYETGLINQGDAIVAGDKTLAVSDGYPAGWMTPMVYDSVAVPKVGQLVSFALADGTIATAEYGIIQVDTTAKTILLDRPLVTAVDDNGIMCCGPDGDYNFALHRNAVALVNRPLSVPLGGTGANSAVIAANNMAMRVCITYDGLKQATRITVDGLFGVGVLDSQLGGVMYG